MSSNVVPIHRPRTLEQILGEIRREAELIQELDRQWRATRADNLADLASAAEDRHFALKAEAMNMIRDQLGVSWSVISSYLD